MKLPTRPGWCRCQVCSGMQQLRMLHGSGMPQPFTTKACAPKAGY